MCNPPGIFSTEVALPKGLTCAHCVLQWRYVGGEPKFSLLLLAPVLRYVGGEHNIFSIAIGSHLEIYVGGDTFPFVFEVSWG